MVFQVLDPTNEAAPPLGQLAPRPGSLRGKTVGLISNGKEGTKGYFAHLDRMLRRTVRRRQRHQPGEVELQRAGGWLYRGEIANWDAVVTGIGD